MKIFLRPGWLAASALVAGIIAIAAFTEYSMGRELICKCGTVLPWYGYTNGPGNSQHLSDWYTFSHIIHGFIFYGFLRLVLRKLPVQTRLVLAVLMETAWEIFENTNFTINRYRAATIALDYVGDSVINSMFDILFATLGFVLAWRWPVWLSITFIIAAETIVGYLVHDNLALNIIMLIAPLESIKSWQAGPSPWPHAPPGM